MFPHLDHELGDDAVEAGALVVQRLARGPGALLPSGQGAEVLNRLGDRVAKQALETRSVGGLPPEDIKGALALEYWI